MGSSSILVYKVGWVPIGGRGGPFLRKERGDFSPKEENPWDWALSRVAGKLKEEIGNWTCFRADSAAIQSEDLM